MTSIAFAKKNKFQWQPSNWNRDNIKLGGHLSSWERAPPKSSGAHAWIKVSSANMVMPPSGRLPAGRTKAAEVMIMEKNENHIVLDPSTRTKRENWLVFYEAHKQLGGDTSHTNQSTCFNCHEAQSPTGWLSQIVPPRKTDGVSTHEGVSQRHQFPSYLQTENAEWATSSNTTWLIQRTEQTTGIEKKAKTEA